MQSHQSAAKAKFKAFAVFSAVALAIFGCYRHMSHFPTPGLVGQTRTEDATSATRNVSDRLRDDLLWLCEDIGRRTSRFSPQATQLRETIQGFVKGSGFELETQEYKAGRDTFHNIIGVRQGTGSGTVLIGTHYDSYGKSVCANATGTGVVTLMEVIRALGRDEVSPTVIVGFFGTGEKPHVGRPTMGAQVWLDAHKEAGKTLDAAYLIGSFGYFLEGQKGQNSSFPWYLSHPKSADWVGVYGAFLGRDIVENTLAQWGRETSLPARGFAAPTWMLGVPAGDQIPFQKAGIPSVLICDTAGNRDPNLRKSSDVPYAINFEAMAERVVALSSTLRAIVTAPISTDAVADAR